MMGLVIQHINIGSKRCVFFISLSVAINYTIFHNNKYKYKAYPLAEESDGSDFNSFAYIDPLRKLLTHSFVEVPLEVSTETQKPLYLIIKVNDKEYKYIVR